MLSVCFSSILIAVLWFEVCRSEETTLGSDIDGLIPHKVQPKVFVVLLPPVFSVIGVTLIAVSILTTIFCVAYCVFLPWAHALATKTVVAEVAATAAPSVAAAAAGVPNQPPYYGGAIPQYPHYAGGGGPYFPNQPYPYYAGPQPPPTEGTKETTTTTTTTTTKPAPTTSPTPDEQNIKETEEFIWD